MGRDQKNSAAEYRGNLVGAGQLRFGFTEVLKICMARVVRVQYVGTQADQQC